MWEVRGGMKLTEDDFDEDYDADVYSMIITKIFDSEKERDDFKRQILDDQKLRELIEKRTEELKSQTREDQICRIIEVLEKLLEDSKN